MKAELQKKLFKKYPTLFAQKDLPMNQTCMCWGIDVGDGWYDLIDELCQKIMELDPEGRIQFVQVKEKFGSLRAYEGGVPSDIADELFDLIHKYEDKSTTICEACGVPAKIRYGGWVITLCDKCYADWKERGARALEGN